MRNTIYIFFALLVITSYSMAQDRKTQEQTNSVFTKMELDGVDTKKPLLYGFFFYDNDKLKLEKLKDELVKDNYKPVRLEATDKLGFILHVERIEIHSRASLLQRDSQLETLSKKFQVALYDGWDIGNVDPTKPLVTETDFEKSLQNKSVAELYVKASGLYDNDMYDKAIAVFQKCIDRDYRTDTCYYKQGVSYVSLGQTTTGLNKLEEALKINPTYYKACFNLGAIYYDIREDQKSVNFYQKAVKLNPQDDRVYYGIAASQFALKQLKDAESNCVTALKLNPNNNDAKTLLERIKTTR